MRLLIARKEMFDYSKIGVFFDRDCPLVRDIVGDAGRRREVEIFESFPRVVEDRIDDEIELSQMPTDDWAYFLSVVVRIPMFGIIAEFEINAVEKGLLSGVRHDEQLPHLKSVQHWTEIAGVAVERQIQALLEPIRDAIGPFRHAVERMFGNEAAGKARASQPVKRVIVKDREIEHAQLCNLGIIDLDLIGLGKRRRGPNYRQDGDENSRQGSQDTWN